MYCRETWADLSGMGFGNDPETDNPWLYAYKADIVTGSDSDRARIDYGVKWRPSIHIPREAARLFFRVPKVEDMRLDDVTEEFAIDDGFKAYLLIDGSDYMVLALHQFIQFRLSAYGPDARWMWVYWTEPVTRGEALQGEKGGAKSTKRLKDIGSDRA